jgi:hypothetical protein
LPFTVVVVTSERSESGSVGVSRVKVRVVVEVNVNPDGVRTRTVPSGDSIPNRGSAAGRYVYVIPSGVCATVAVSVYRRLDTERGTGAQ